jgi:hypothetical protein
MLRRASGISPSTAAELDFLGRIIATELRLNQAGLESELGRCVLGRGNRLEIRFGARGACISVGNAISSELENPAVREMWRDVLDLFYASKLGLVLVRVVVSLPVFDSSLRSSGEIITYCSAKRPRWLPLAL